MHIHRKAHGRIVERKSDTNHITTSDKLQAESNIVLNELEHQYQMKNDLEERLQFLEQQNDIILNENLYLKQMVIDSTNKQIQLQDRMEKIFQVLYMCIKNGTPTGLPQIMNSRPSGSGLVSYGFD